MQVQEIFARASKLANPFDERLITPIDYHLILQVFKVCLLIENESNVFENVDKKLGAVTIDEQSGALTILIINFIESKQS